jgi:hypothetical protein
LATMYRHFILAEYLLRRFDVTLNRQTISGSRGWWLRRQSYRSCLLKREWRTGRLISSNHRCSQLCPPFRCHSVDKKD